MPYTAPQLLAMSRQELHDLFSESPSGEIPNGEAEGTAILAPDTKFNSTLASIIEIFGWKGKTFNAAKGTLTNRILPMGVNAIVAEVYKQESWFDQKECIVLDYSKTSMVAKHIRDEIRQIAPGTYLGMIFGDREPAMYFALRFGNNRP